MKRYVAILIIICLLFAVILAVAFVMSFDIPEYQQLTELSKVIMQSILAGTVTFLGLFLTICSQENQVKNNLRESLCPCIIVQKSSGLSAIKDVSSQKVGKGVIICTREEKIRTIDCSLYNCKDNYGLNLSVESIHGKVCLGNIENELIDITIAINGEKNGFITLMFNDVYGEKYTETIKYHYRGIDNSVMFNSSEPKRRK